MSKEIPVDVRILECHPWDWPGSGEGRFRQDLFYRINVIELKVPSLRERQSDIPLLARHILKRIAEECGIDGADISADAMIALQSYGFPGNVRELENVIERAFTLCEGDVIQVQDLQLDRSASPL